MLQSEKTTFSSLKTKTKKSIPPKAPLLTSPKKEVYIANCPESEQVEVVSDKARSP